MEESTQLAMTRTPGITEIDNMVAVIFCRVQIVTGTLAGFQSSIKLITGS